MLFRSVSQSRYLGGQEMGLQLANLASQIKLNESQANKNNAEANKTAGVDTELAKTSIENLINQTKNEKGRNALIWAEKRFKEAAADMQEASAKLASGQNAQCVTQSVQPPRGSLAQSTKRPEKSKRAGKP